MPKDRGGNGILVTLPGATQSVKLHSTWDTNLVDGAFHGQNETTIAKGLARKHKAKAAAWQQGESADWLPESHELAVKTAYGKPPGFTCGVKLGKPPVPIDDHYVTDARAIIEEQLTKAGIGSPKY